MHTVSHSRPYCIIYDDSCVQSYCRHLELHSEPLPVCRSNFLSFYFRIRSEYSKYTKICTIQNFPPIRYFNLAELIESMYFTKAASIKSKADILLLVKSFSCNDIEPCKSMQIGTDCKITNNIVIPWPSHHALTSTGVRTEANTNRLSKNDCIQHNSIKFLHVSSYIMSSYGRIRQPDLE